MVIAALPSTKATANSELASQPQPIVTGIPRGGIHNGWRLASHEKIQSPKEIKDLASDSKRLLNEIIQENPGTPWEVLAKRERFVALGLAWQPANFGQ